MKAFFGDMTDGANATYLKFFEKDLVQKNLKPVQTVTRRKGVNCHETSFWTTTKIIPINLKS